jgi:hypothetical protein
MTPRFEDDAVLALAEPLADELDHLRVMGSRNVPEGVFAIGQGISGRESPQRLLPYLIPDLRRQILAL